MGRLEFSTGAITWAFSEQIYFSGTAFYKNGDVWTGNFIDEHYHQSLTATGVVTIRYPDGTIYSGEVLGSDRHGKGSLLLANGNSILGTWQFGELVEAQDSKSDWLSKTQNPLALREFV